MSEITNSETISRDLAVVQTNVTQLKDDVKEIKMDVKQIASDTQNKFVTKDEFDPIKRLVYFSIGILLAGVIGGILSLILKK